MAEYVGKSLYLLWNGTDLSNHFRSFNPSEAADVEDGSAGSDTHRVYYPTLIDGNASAEFVAQDGTAGTALWAAIAPNTSGTLEWGPEGTAAGKPRKYVTAYLTTRDEDIAYDGIVVWNIEWQYSDADGPTNGTY